VHVGAFKAFWWMANLTASGVLRKIHRAGCVVTVGRPVVTRCPWARARGATYFFFFFWLVFARAGGCLWDCSAALIICAAKAPFGPASGRAA